MEHLIDLGTSVAGDVWATTARVWPFLVISVVAAAAINVYVGSERASALLGRRTLIATVGAVALATLTPFCSCGTTAVMLGMLASSTPWAPLVAFMVASPLTSPSELLLSAGLFGWSFAWLFFGGTIVLGLGAGLVGWGLDRAGFLARQARMEEAEPGCAAEGCSTTESVALSLGPGTATSTEVATLRQRWKLDDFGSEVVTIGRKLALFFFGFTAIGYLVIEAIPTAWLADYLGGDSVLAVPVAALIGVPAYISTEASLPLVASLMDGGMGPGPAMAFLVTGAGTSLGAISGLFVIARVRVVGLVVALLFAGALVLGWFAQVALG